LCIFAGICSGLTVGYLSIDSISLEIKVKTGTNEERSAVSFLLLNNKKGLSNLVNT